MNVSIAEIAESVPLTMVGNLPCPFCGSTNLSKMTPRKETAGSWVLCEACGATGPVGRTECEARWNARAFDRDIFIRSEDFQMILEVNKNQK